MRRKILFTACVMVLAALACGTQTPTTTFNTPGPTAAPVPALSIFERKKTTYGFFPSPPEPIFESVLNHFEALGEHADFILFQSNIPWEDFIDGIEGESQSRTDIRNQVFLAQQNGLEWVFVVDPLNGFNRREFLGLPEGWQASFANPDVRTAFTNFALWIVREFQPRYLGLASEINTYMDAHPNDVPNYVSLYEDVYDRVKAGAPDTQVFVTFQWGDLNNLFPGAEEGRQPYHTNWDQIEIFEPRLDLWVISSYPFAVFKSGSEIPEDYYTPLLERTDKPLAVAEGGYTSQPIGPFQGGPQDQVDYLQAIHDQLGERLNFWVYLLLTDLNMELIPNAAREAGLSETDLETLEIFAFVGLRNSDGTPKPALEVWDRYRAGE